MVDNFTSPSPTAFFALAHVFSHIAYESVWLERCRQHSLPPHQLIHLLERFMNFEIETLRFQA